MTRPIVRAAIVALVIAALGGCNSMEKQLESVAKDWCMTIRASQVIPVYPLTEDLQPGDVFLLTVPVQKQVEIYRKRGFLPLDLAITRLHGLDYAGYYAAEYWTGDFVPDGGHARMVRGAKTAVAEDSEPTDKADDGTDDGGDGDAGTITSPGILAAFALAEDLGAPRAAFPTYTFSVKKGMGARLAIPVQGVPVALGFMRTSSAVGSITISDAYTYAAPTEDLILKLQEWIEATPGARTMLSQLQAENQGTTLYLRVVQRVYLTGGVVVSVTNESATGGGGEADLSVLGAPSAALSAPNGNTSGGGQTPSSSDGIPAGTRLEDVNKALSAALSDKSPGASLRILQASSRSVSMKENFDRPLVIGYLGLDFPIGEGGRLGVPIATLDQLAKRDGTVVRPLLANEMSSSEAQIDTILEMFAMLERSTSQQDRDRARVFVINAALRISDPDVQAVGTKVSDGAIPEGVWVKSLRMRINSYLSTTEPGGEGGIHRAVVGALSEASK